AGPSRQWVVTAWGGRPEERSEPGGEQSRRVSRQRVSMAGPSRQWVVTAWGGRPEERSERGGGQSRTAGTRCGGPTMWDGLFRTWRVCETRSVQFSLIIGT